MKEEAQKGARLREEDPLERDHEPQGAACSGSHHQVGAMVLRLPGVGSG